jgi:choline kinase
VMSSLVILAAGMGTRLRDTVHKPLKVIHGVPLIVHQINRFYCQGISHFYIVTGYKEQLIQEALLSYDYGCPVTVEFISNPQWEKGNGMSVYAAAQYLKGSFFLTMTDHVFSARFIKQFLDVSLNDKLPMSTLVTDVLGDHNTYLDLDDVTKVQTDKDGLILNIGKELPVYNKVDTGLFYFTQEIERSLYKAQQHGNFSLSGGVDQLSCVQRMGTYDCAKAFWMDVDTPGDFDYAVSIKDKEVFV